jgi:hypothetical protein
MENTENEKNAGSYGKPTATHIGCLINLILKRTLQSESKIRDLQRDSPNRRSGISKEMPKARR